MTKQEIIASLEGLKDFVNDNGKHAIDGIKTAVNALQEQEAAPEAVVPEPQESVKEELPMLSEPDEEIPDENEEEEPAQTKDKEKAKPKKETVKAHRSKSVSRR